MRPPLRKPSVKSQTSAVAGTNAQPTSRTREARNPGSPRQSGPHQESRNQLPSMTERKRNVWRWKIGIVP